jgi:hypothetical protein
MTDEYQWETLEQLQWVIEVYMQVLSTDNPFPLDM